MVNKEESFFEKVYYIVQKIPYGKVTTYGAIAEYLSTKTAVRMVGWAMNASHHYSHSIPAHRVVNRNGCLTGKHHFETPLMMEQLLINEGAIIENDQIINEKSCH